MKIHQSRTRKIVKKKSNNNNNKVAKDDETRIKRVSSKTR